MMFLVILIMFLCVWRKHLGKEMVFLYFHREKPQEDKMLSKAIFEPKNSLLGCACECHRQSIHRTHVRVKGSHRIFCTSVFITKSAISALNKNIVLHKYNTSVIPPNKK
mmetsp:Transcript_13039/g.19295  ORF Transcript_13039/g.19295 Transcript_13039/m.19295 type:complete len:109 (+) Transcript_13039:1357-1683(+)